MYCHLLFILQNRNTNFKIFVGKIHCGGFRSHPYSFSSFIQYVGKVHVMEIVFVDFVNTFFNEGTIDPLHLFVDVEYRKWLH